MTEQSKSDPQNASPTPGSHRRSRKRWLWLGGGAVVVALLLLVLLLPTLLSSGPGSRWVMGVASDSVRGVITADDLSLGWFSGQSVTGLRIADADDQTVVTVDEIALPDASLLGLAFGGRDLGDIAVRGVRGTVKRDTDGRINLVEALEPPGQSVTPPPVPVGPSESDAGGLPMALSLALNVTDVDLSYEQPDTDPVRLVVPELRANIAGLNDIAVVTEATLALGGESGTATLDATVRGLFDTSGRANPVNADIDARAKIVSLPIGAVDRLADRGGLLVAMLGPTLDASLDVDGSASDAVVHLAADAQHLHALGRFAINGEAITLGEDATATLTLTPEAWSMLAGGASSLNNPVTLTADLYRFSLPRTDAGGQLADAAIESMLSIGDATFTVPGFGQTTFENTKLVIQSDRLADSTILNLASRATLAGRTGGVTIDGDVQRLFDQTGAINLAGVMTHLTGKAERFPAIVLIDALAGQEGKLIDALGATLDARFAAQWEGDAGSIDLTTAVEADSGRADITSQTTFGRADSDSPIELRDTQTTVTDLPVALVETLTETGYDLGVLLGPKLDRITVDVTGDPRDESDFGLVVASPKLSADLAGTYRPEAITLEADSGGTLIVSPDAFAWYLAQTGDEQVDMLQLVDPLVIALAVPRATVALPYDPARVDVEATVALSKLVVDRRDGQRIHFEEVSLGLVTSNLRDQLTLNLAGRVGHHRDATTRGDLRSATVITGLYNDQDAIDPANLTLDTDTALIGFPVDLLDRIAGYDGQLVAMLGDTADITAKGAIPGALRLQFDSPVVTAPLALNINRERDVTLEEDFVAEIRPTEKTFDLILGKIQPILADAVASQEPMRLTIFKDGTLVPIMDFDIADVTVKGEVNLGQIRMDRRGWFNQALGEIFTRIGESLGLARSKYRVRGGTYLATFTPMTFDLRDGQVTTTQLWMTSQDMAVGFDTRADLVNDRLDMMMGMVGGTLSAGLPVIRPGIDVAAIYDIPVRGNLSNPKADVLPLVTGILANSAGNIGGLFGGDGGKIGQIIGQVAGVVTNATLASSKRDWKPPLAVAEFVEAQGGDPRKIDPNYVPKEEPKEEERPRHQPRDNNPLRDLLGL